MKLKQFIIAKLQENAAAQEYFAKNFLWRGRFLDGEEDSIMQGSIKVCGKSFNECKRKVEKLFSLMNVIPKKSPNFWDSQQPEIEYVFEDGTKAELARYKKKLGGGCGLFPGLGQSF